jgi:L-threonylcarbamoyladenylate synthase
VTGAAEVGRAVDALRDGALVAFPTETVYGLGADARNPAALARLYAVKGRPAAHPVIVHLGGRAQLDGWARAVSPMMDALASAFWPGPLTLVVPRAPGVLDQVTGGAATVGLRVPDQPLALELLRAFGDGLAAPSANRFGRVSPTTADDVRADLGDDVALVLDGGPCRVGVESTIVDCSGDVVRILRPGAVTVAEIEAVVHVPVGRADDGSVPAPGTLPSHYAPVATVVLVDAGALAARARELVDAGRSVALLALAGTDAGGVARVTVLDSPRDVDEYARVLYSRLREVDARGIDVLLAVPPPEDGLGVAVADRLRRAAGRGRA